MALWEADIEVGEDLVRTVLAKQFPELDASSARLLGEGWDNSVWVVEERIAFRFPRRAIAAPLAERELAVLPRLAPLVPIPVPVPTHVGKPDGCVPWPFFGCPLLEGAEPAEAELSDEARVTLGGQLGGFLRALHDPATLGAVDPGGRLPRDPNLRANMPQRVERTRAWLRSLAEAGIWRATAEVADVLAAAELLPDSSDSVLAHSDLHARHVLVSGGGLSAVIDWGDVCVADPAIDLVLYWSLLPAAGRRAFVAAYGDVGEDRLLRARVLSFFHGAILALYARDVGHAALERECVAGLERTMTA